MVLYAGGSRSGRMAESSQVVHNNHVFKEWASMAFVKNDKQATAKIKAGPIVSRI
jgi:hypothetical protein